MYRTSTVRENSCVMFIPKKEGGRGRRREKVRQRQSKGKRKRRRRGKE